jgi:hypothetical protein
MTIIPFPSCPTLPFVQRSLFTVSTMFPAWTVDCFQAEDGRPYAEAVHKVLRTVIGFHWRPNQWAAIDENATVLVERTSLTDLMRIALS